MGVVYKLTDHVIAYILQLKKEDSLLSCRSLAQMASEKFSIPISKSSVNTLLKNAQLSNTVGRPSGKAVKLQKFKIPTEKKEAIRENLNRNTAEEILEKVPKIAKPDLNLSKKAPVFQKNPPPKLSIESFKGNQSEGVSPAPKEELAISRKEETRALIETVKESRITSSEPKGHLYNGMGIILLKAAEWEMTDKPFLANLIKKYIQGPLTNNFEESCCALMLLKLLGLQSLENINQFKDHALWKLCDLDEKILPVFDWIQFIQNPQQLVMEYLNEREQIFFETYGYRLVIENGEKIELDAFLIGFLTESRKNKSVSIAKALINISNIIVSPEHVFNFYLSESDGEFSKSFIRFVHACENIAGGKVISVETIGKQGEKITELPAFLGHKKHFVVGIAPWQKEFKDLTKAARFSAKREIIYKNTLFHFSDTTTNIPDTSSSLRLLALWQHNESEPFWGVLVNHYDRSAEDLLNIYLEKWFDDKNFGKAALSVDAAIPQIFQKRTEQVTLKEDVQGFWDTFRDYGLCLDRYVRQHFLNGLTENVSLTEIISDIYNLPGYYKTNEKEITVTLAIPPSFKHKAALDYALRIIKIIHVSNFSKQKLNILIDF
jgi:hypothetical protein